MQECSVVGGSKKCDSKSWWRHLRKI